MIRPREEQHHPEEHKGGGFKSFAALFLALPSLIIALASGFFTYQQGCVADDQEVRTLRAYLIVSTPDAVAFSIDSKPSIILDAVSKGQTPVYNMHAFYGASVEQYFIGGFHKELNINCARETSDSLGGDTFADNDKKSVTPTDADFHGSWSDFMGHKAVLSAYGTACYQDVFSRTHTLRFCFMWQGPDDGPKLCRQEDFAQVKLGEVFEGSGRCTPQFIISREFTRLRRYLFGEPVYDPWYQVKGGINP